MVVGTSFSRLNLIPWKQTAIDRLAKSYLSTLAFMWSPLFRLPRGRSLICQVSRFLSGIIKSLLFTTASPKSTSSSEIIELRWRCVASDYNSAQYFDPRLPHSYSSIVLLPLPQLHKYIQYKTLKRPRCYREE